MTHDKAKTLDQRVREILLPITTHFAKRRLSETDMVTDLTPAIVALVREHTAELEHKVCRSEKSHIVLGAMCTQLGTGVIDFAHKRDSEMEQKTARIAALEAELAEWRTTAGSLYAALRILLDRAQP